MAQDPKIIVEQFIQRRAKNPDTPADPWDPKRDGSPLEVPTPVQLSKPAAIPFQEAPKLSTPAVIPLEQAPALGKPAEIALEPAPPLSTPAVIPLEPAPKLSVPAVIPFEPAPPLGTPAVIPFEPAPPLGVPAAIPFEPAPALSSPAIIPLEPAPALSVPAQIPFEPAPPLSSPAQLGFQPAPPLSSPASIPFEPAPPLSAPIAPSLQPAPPLTSPANLPAQPAPPLGSPASLPPPPSFSPAPNAKLPAMPVPSLGSPSVLPSPPKVTITPVHQPYGPGTPPNLPGPFVAGDPSSDPLERLRRTDQNIKTILAEIDSNGRYVEFASGPGTQALNPDLYAKGLARLGAHLGVNGMALFAAEQLGLFLLNRHGKIWNPVTMAPPPIVQNFVPAALDVLTGTPRLMTGYDDTNGVADMTSKPGFYEANHGPYTNEVHLDLAKGEYNEVRVVHYPPFVEAVFGAGSVGVQNLLQGAPLLGNSRVIGARSQDTSLVDDLVKGSDGTTKPIVQAALELRNKYYPGEEVALEGITYPEHAVSQMADLVDDALDGGTRTGHVVAGDKSSLREFTYRSTSQAGADDPDPGFLGKITAAGKAFLGDRIQLKTGEWRPETGEASRAKSAKTSKLARAAFPRGVIPAKIPGENDKGVVVTRNGESPTKYVQDDDAYVPVSFTDLRPSGGSYRTIYFRPFITSFNESFAPEWNKRAFFGRADPVAGYVATGRSINLGFKVAAFGPEDLRVIYDKLAWLTSMVYPEYDNELLYLSGPVIRLRIGDVINAIGPEGGRGLPGVLDSLEFDYTDVPWELKEGLKVPQSVVVSLAFTVLHDRPIGRGAGGKFGGLGTVVNGRFTPPGKSPSTGAGSGDDVVYPEVVRGMDSFRSIGKSDADSMNDYDKLTPGNNVQSV